MRSHVAAYSSRMTTRMFVDNQISSFGLRYYSTEAGCCLD